MNYYSLQTYSFSVSSNKGFIDTMNDIDPNGFTIKFLLLSGVIFLVVLGFVLIQVIKRNNNLLGKNDLQTCKQITMFAKVIDKRDLRPGGNVADPYCHIIFESENGDRLDFAFRVNDSKYHSIVIGDSGSLTYAGRAFIDFQRISN